MNRPLILCFLFTLATGFLLGCEADMSAGASEEQSEFNAPPAGNNNQGGFYTWSDEEGDADSNTDPSLMMDVSTGIEWDDTNAVTDDDAWTGPAEDILFAGEQGAENGDENGD